jgi:hypothetical protein
MARAEDEVKQYLYQSESIREAFDVGPVRVVLTSHRVFASLPDEGGIQQAELPNVTGVERQTRGSLSGVVWGISIALVGVAFLAVGLAVSTSDAFTTPTFQEDAAAEAGAGSLTDLVEMVIWVVENLDVMMLWGGAFFLVLAVLPVVHYWVRVREQTLTIQLAGEQADIHLPLEYIAVEDEFRLEKALVPEQVSDDLPVDDMSADETDRPDERGTHPDSDERSTHPDSDGTSEALADDDDDAPGSPVGTGATEDDTDGGFEWIGTDESTGEPTDGASTDGDP